MAMVVQIQKLRTTQKKGQAIESIIES